MGRRIAHLRQECHNSKCVIFQERLLKRSAIIFCRCDDETNALQCYNFLSVRRRHKCSPVASFANCVMTLCLLKVDLITFLSILITQKCQILSCDTLVANEQCIISNSDYKWRWRQYVCQKVGKFLPHYNASHQCCEHLISHSFWYHFKGILDFIFFFSHGRLLLMLVWLEKIKIVKLLTK